MRARIIGAVLAGLVLAAPAWAEGFADAIIRQLQAQGFTEFSTSRTLLGRTRIVASGAAGSREIVLNPATGEILRDLWLLQTGEGGIFGLSGGASGNGGDTNGSNSASDNSGSGSSGSGGNSGSDNDTDDSGSDDNSGSDGDSGDDGE